jgi:hypothetical protein
MAVFVVSGAVAHAVRWGLEHRGLDEVYAIGVDELAWKKGLKKDRGPGVSTTRASSATRVATSQCAR